MQNIIVTVTADNNCPDTRKIAANYPRYHFKTLDYQAHAFAIWNADLQHSSADVLIYLPDDTELDFYMLAELDKVMQPTPDIKKPDLLVGINQQNIPQTKDLAGIGAIGMAFADRFPARQCFCPDYIAFSADAELAEYAKLIGKFKWCENVRLMHHHPACSNDSIDEAHKLVRAAAAEHKKIRKERKDRKFLWGQNFDLLKNKDGVIND